MIHARDDYNRIQDPAINDSSLLGKDCWPIAENEPVFLLRGQDFLMPDVLEYYAALVKEDNPEMALTVQEHVRLVKEWQKKHGRKIPDMPGQIQHPIITDI